MSRKIVIIHTSLVIRRGLSAIFRNYFDGEVISLESIPEQDFFAEGFFDALFVEEGFLLTENRLFVKIKSNKIRIVAISFLKEPRISQTSADDCLSVHSNEQEISDILKNIIQTGTIVEEHEGEELTLREKEVLKMVALGYSNKIIADKLFISIHTVISHRKNITEKLGIKSISGLTVYAMINRIINPEEIDTQQLI